MRKSTRIVKRIMALFLVVLMSINSFGAVVSDNDGSAFITKAEFDSLKNNFQSQIDQYNTSIDSKIDGAIAAYLAGINFVKKMPLNNLVSNYTLMRWFPSWKIYGKMKHWTGYNTYTELATKQWHEPHFAEKRVNTRANSFGLTDVSTHQFGALSVALTGTIKNWSNKVMMGPGGNSGLDSQADSPPVSALRLIKDGNEWFLRNDSYLFTYWWVCPVYIHGHARQRYAQGSGTDVSDLYATQDWDLVGDASQRDPWFETLSNPNAVLDYKVYWKRVGNTGKFKNWYRQIIKDGDYQFPLAYSCSNMYHSDTNPKGYSVTTCLGLAAQSEMNVDSLIDSGVTWEWIDPITYNVQYQYLYYMMLGKDNNQSANVYKNTGNLTSYEILDTSGTDTFATVKVNVSTVSFNNLYYYSTETAKYTPINFDMDVNLPTLPVVKISQLSNGIFKYNGIPLKMGQGLPIVIDSLYDGYVQISFDYDVRRDVPTAATNKNICFSIKTDDFNSTGTNFKEGYTKILDPNMESGTLVRFKDYNYTSTDGKLHLTVPIKKDESLWFRMAPQDDSGGFFASMSNLSCTLLTES